MDKRNDTSHNATRDTQDTDLGRRNTLKLGGAAAAGVIAGAPAIVRADNTFQWRMTNDYPAEFPFLTAGPGSPADFAERVANMSDGRLQIQQFPAGELIPALEGFDAVSEGTIEMNHSTSYFWAGRQPSAQFFSSMPFGLNFPGKAAWLYHGGGLELWNKVYEDYNMVVFPANDSGLQMTGWFREPIESKSDLDGLIIRIPGIAQYVYEKLGAQVELLPGGEIYPALERGVIDAAEFVGPYVDRHAGLQGAAKYYHTTGWHEPATVSEFKINRDAWEELPDDLQEIVRTAAQACHLESTTWLLAKNPAALKDLVDNYDVEHRPLPEDVVEALRTGTNEVLEEQAAEDAMFAEVLDSYIKFRDEYWGWVGVSEGDYYNRVIK